MTAATSILKLCLDPSAPRKLPVEVSYPDDGAANLAAMEQDHFWFTERRNLILRTIRENLRTGALGADIGCGTGFTSVWLCEQGFPTVGIDALPGFLPLKQSGRGMGFVQTDLMQCSLAPEFDFVLLLDTLEHIRDDREFADHVLKLVKPGGYALITVPAFPSLWSPVDETSGHFRRYTKKSLLSVLPKTFSVEISMYYYASLLPMYVAARALAKRNGGKTPSAEYRPSNLVNRTCRGLLKAERSLFYPYGFPVGSSLFVVLRKPLDGVFS